MANGRQDHAAFRFRAVRSALDDFAHVPVESGVDAMQHAQARIGGRVVRPTADDDVDVRMLRQHRGERLAPHLRHDLRRCRHVVVRQRAGRPARGDPSGIQPPVHQFGIDARKDGRKLEAIVLGGCDLSDHGNHVVHVAVDAGAAGGADDQRNPSLGAGLQQQRQVSHGGSPADQHGAQPELIRSGIGRAGIDDDGVEATVDAAPEMVGGDAVSQHADRGQYLQLILGLGASERPFLGPAKGR